MRRAMFALVLAAGLVVPAVAAAEGEGGTAETRAVDRVAALKKQRDEAVARRDRALLQFHTYGLPKYSLEAEEAAKDVARLEQELAEAEKAR